MEFDIVSVDWMAKLDGMWLMVHTKGADASKVCGMVDPNKEYVFAIKEKTKKRSLDANAYAWVLLGKLANKIGIPKEEVYRNYIKDVGDNYEIIPIKKAAVDRWIENWQSKGIGWVCEILGDSKLDGYVNVISYYGSSTYDTKQMSALVNLIVEDCKAQGIETMTPAELSALLDNWRN